MRRFRPWPLVAAALAGATGCGRPGDGREGAANQVAVIDPAKHTPSGFPLHRWEMDYPCRAALDLEPPFRVVENGWGQIAIGVPLSVLDNPGERSLASHGPDAQHRLTFSTGRYRGIGMRTWIERSLAARTSGETREPGHRLPGRFRTFATGIMAEDGRVWTDQYRYLGHVPPAHDVALVCSPERFADGGPVPNPFCRGEARNRATGFEYQFELPIRATHRLAEILAIGDRLFAPAAVACRRAGGGTPDRLGAARGQAFSLPNCQIGRSEAENRASPEEVPDESCRTRGRAHPRIMRPGQGYRLQQAAAADAGRKRRVQRTGGCGSGRAAPADRYL